MLIHSIQALKLRTGLVAALTIPLSLATGGCASSSPAPKTSSTGARTTAVASNNVTAKGHWVEEPYPQTGSHIRRRFWVPDGTSEEAAAAAAGNGGSPVESSKPGMRESTRAGSNTLRQG